MLTELPEVPDPRGCWQEPACPHSCIQAAPGGTGAHPSSHEPGLVLRTDPEQCSVYGEGGCSSAEGSEEQTHPPAIRPLWTFTAGLTCQALGTRRELGLLPLQSSLPSRGRQWVGARAIDRKCHFVPGAGQGHRERSAPQRLLDYAGGHVRWGQADPELPAPPSSGSASPPHPRAVQSSCPLWFPANEGNSTHPETRLLPAGI